MRLNLLILTTKEKVYFYCACSYLKKPFYLVTYTCYERYSGESSVILDMFIEKKTKKNPAVIEVKRILIGVHFSAAHNESDVSSFMVRNKSPLQFSCHFSE